MSRIGKQPIDTPAGVEVTIDGSTVTVKGKLGTLTRTFNPKVTIAKEGTRLTVTRADDHRESRALHGLSRALLSNMVSGVTEGFSKTLMIEGIGYKCTPKGNNLEFALGFSHPIIIEPPEGISFESKPTEITIKGIDKEAVGQVAANIRALRKPEPYKGKGIRYKDERIIRKAGKTAVK